MNTITQSSKHAVIAILLVLSIGVDISPAIAQQASHSIAYDTLPDTAMQSYVKSQLDSDEMVNGAHAAKDNEIEPSWDFSSRGLNIRSNWLP